MVLNLVLAVGSVWIAIALWSGAAVARGVAGGFLLLSFWQLYCAATNSRRSVSKIILRFGGFAWRMEDFCRGWLITGQVGTGKTSAAINAMLWQVSKSLLAARERRRWRFAAKQCGLMLRSGRLRPLGIK